MRVAVLHDPVAPGAAPDDLDNLIQAEHVAKALRALEHEVSSLALSASMEETRAALTALSPDAVFNLVEGSGGASRLAHKAPELLASMGLPFTGSAAPAMRLADDKRACKAFLQKCGLPAPPLAGPGEGAAIVKSVFEHASLGLDASSVAAFEDADGLARALDARRKRFGGDWFAEKFIPGREFNLAVLEGTEGPGGLPEALPAAEIVFGKAFRDQPGIVGYRAKWDEDSPEYAQTVRSLDFPASDGPLLALLADLARRTFTAFGLSGYARVDFRVDRTGAPFIIDVNANPCLSPDAGFAAALARSGLTYAGGIARILAAALSQRTIDATTSSRRAKPINVFEREPEGKLFSKSFPSDAFS